MVLEAEKISPQEASINNGSKVRLFSWTLEKYQAATEAGILTKDDSVELLFGQLIDKMSINESHAACVRRLQRYFFKRYLGEFTISTENPIVLPNESVPEPDLAILTYREDDYVNGHPGPEHIHLIVEVSDRTVSKDRGPKLRAYALAGIKEYWIANLQSQQVEMYTKPDTEDGTYGNASRYGLGEVFTSTLCGEVAVNDLLPR